MRLNPEIIKQQIANLLLQFPELAEDDQLRADSIEGETDAFEFLSAVVRLIEDAKILADGTAERVKELNERANRFCRRIEAFRLLAFLVMQAADIKKAELPCATLSIRAGTPKVIVTDEDALPNDAFRVKRTPDLMTIKSWLSAGQEVPGAVMSNAESTLAIRVR